MICWSLSSKPLLFRKATYAKPNLLYRGLEQGFGVAQIPYANHPRWTVEFREKTIGKTILFLGKFHNFHPFSPIFFPSMCDLFISQVKRMISSPGSPPAVWPRFPKPPGAASTALCPLSCWPSRECWESWGNGSSSPWSVRKSFGCGSEGRFWSLRPLLIEYRENYGF